MIRQLNETRDIEQVMKDAWKQTLCPRCDGVMVRGLVETAYPVYACDRCVTRWVKAVPPERVIR
jgi:hypothetical protein